MTSRQALINAASPEQIEKLARSYGFPSARALSTVIQLGDHLSRGGKITDQWMDKIQAAYPAVPRDHLNDIAANVTDVASLAKAVGVEPAVAAEYVKNYNLSTESSAISDRMDSRVDNFRKAELPNRPELALKSTLRETLERAASEQSIDLKDAPAQVRRSAIADGLERNAALSAARREHINSGELEERHRGPAIDVALAYDQHVTTEAAEQELLTADVEPALVD